ncbi:epoxide hydrolase 1-like [Nicotiana tabacum]|uniref:Epoxide hydrolase 1-like n=1 Tax=Nicotiana tabacum TaxID=4097 RepID=A0AC58SKP9_TOBAC
MEGVEHKTVSVNGINMHYAEIGKGPLVLFIHGFPECWYSWRHQMSFMANHGYRAVAPDLRGYGDTATGVPNKDDPSNFTTLSIVGDLVELLNSIAPQEEKVFVVGHDWGAVVSWALCLYRPDKVKGFFCLSVAFNPRNPMKKPLETLRAVYGDDYYVVRFQEAGVIEAEFEEIGVKNVLKKFFTYREPAPLYFKKGKSFGDNPQVELPCWLSEEELDFYATKYEQTGFTGALNFYRAIDRRSHCFTSISGAKIQVPVKFIVGELDLTYNAPGTKDYLHKGGFKKQVPLLEEVVVLEGVGHFIHEEKPKEINDHIYNFIRKISSSNQSKFCAIL